MMQNKALIHQNKVLIDQNGILINTIVMVSGAKVQYMKPPNKRYYKKPGPQSSGTRQNNEE